MINKNSQTNQFPILNSTKELILQTNEETKFFNVLDHSLLLEEARQGMHLPFMQNAVGKLALIENFVLLLETTDASQLLSKSKRRNSINECQSKQRKEFSTKIHSLLRKRILNVCGMEYLSEQFILSERTQLFLETYNDHGKGIIDWALDEGLIAHNAHTYDRCIDVINDFIKALRQRAQASEFRKKIAHRIEKSKRQLDSMNALVDSLLTRYSRLLIIRIDLGYETSQSTELPNRIDRSNSELDLIIKHREQFTNNMRHNSTIFSNCVGYILKLEQGLYGGFHLHGFFVFNGSHVQSDYFYGEEIGKYWKKITISSELSANGRYYNCNASATRYKKIGIGFVNYYDFDKINIIKGDVLGYFSKESLYLVPKTTKNVRTLTRSSIPKITNKGLARGPKRSIIRQTIIHNLGNGGISA